MEELLCVNGTWVFNFRGFLWIGGGFPNDNVINGRSYIFQAL